MKEDICVYHMDQLVLHVMVNKEIAMTLQFLIQWSLENLNLHIVLGLNTVFNPKNNVTQHHIYFPFETQVFDY